MGQQAKLVPSLPVYSAEMVVLVMKTLHVHRSSIKPSREILKSKHRNSSQNVYLWIYKQFAMHEKPLRMFKHSVIKEH